MNARRILFLDIDGVLNRSGVSYRCDDWPFKMREPSAIAQLERVRAATGCELALSSTWRLSTVGQAIREGHLSTAWGVDWPFVAFTPRNHRVVGPHERLPSNLRRAAEIAATLRQLRGVTSWAAVDDMAMSEHGIRGVWTDGAAGLTAEDADALIELLMVPCEPEVTAPGVLAELERREQW